MQLRLGGLLTQHAVTGDAALQALTSRIRSWRGNARMPRQLSKRPAARSSRRRSPSASSIKSRWGAGS